MQFREIEDIVFYGNAITISEDVFAIVNESYNFLEKFSVDKVIYGINTGFGPMAQHRIYDDKVKELQYNIVRSHSCGAGQALSPLVVRAAMLSRLQTFLKGKSGVSSDVVDILSKFINNNIIPFIPQHGGVGASGDLVQLSHLALSLIGEGECFYANERRKVEEVLSQLQIQALQLKLRDGLALCNGTSVMTGLGIVNLHKAKQLFNASLLSSVLINEISSSYDDFISETLNELKNHRGQSKVAQKMRLLASSSKCLLNRESSLYVSTDESIFKHKVQPFYSLRCTPQILGPILEVLENVEKILVEEFNAVDDNPIVDVETQNVYHGGNFHGDYVSFEMDKLKIAMTKMIMLTERQLNYLLHDKINGILPPFLNLGKLGLNYGLQGAQFTATSTTAECQTLSNPMYVHSIPCNNDNQDIVSMGTNAGLITERVIDNGFQVMAINFIALAQAVDYLDIKHNLSEETRRLYDNIRLVVPLFVDDTPKYKEIESLIDFIKKYKGI